MYIDKIQKILNINSTCHTLYKWDTIETNMNLIFPSDYKEFINNFDFGGINEFICLTTPFDNPKGVSLNQLMEKYRLWYIESQNKYPNDFQYKFYPGDEGLFPWGFTDNGDMLYWLKKDNKWNIVVYNQRSNYNRQYDMGFTEFIYKICSNELICDLFPEDVNDMLIYESYFEKN